MLKGITTIELTDIKSGEVKKIEETNFVTNAFRDISQPILKNQDTIFGLVFRDEGGLTTEAALRGLLLFDKNLGENANNYFPPANAKMIGHGGAITYTGSDISLGSFNTNQSDVISANERTYVWDFTAEQANGIINSVCLTTQAGGQVGYGSLTKSEATSAVLKPFTNMIKSRIRATHNSIQAPVNRVPVYMNFKDDYLLLFDALKLSTGSLTFYKVNLGSSTADIFKRFNNLSFIDVNNRNTNLVGDTYTSITEEIKTLPSEFSTGGYYGLAQDGKYLYITSGSNSQESNVANAWAAGTTISILKIDLETLSHEVLTVTNTSGEPLAIRVANSTYTSGCYTFGVTNGYLFARQWVANAGAEVAKLFAINLANNTDVVLVKDKVGKETTVGVSHIPQATPFTMTLKGKVAFATKANKPNDYTYTGSNVYGSLGVVSTESFTAEYYGCSSESLFTPGSLSSSNSSFSKIFATDNPLYFCTEERSGEYSSAESTFYVHVYPNVLMTINNLSSPIEKTPSQTMRVTYKIVKE